MSWNRSAEREISIIDKECSSKVEKATLLAQSGIAVRVRGAGVHQTVLDGIGYLGRYRGIATAWFDVEIFGKTTSVGGQCVVGQVYRNIRKDGAIVKGRQTAEHLRFVLAGGGTIGLPIGLHAGVWEDCDASIRTPIIAVERILKAYNSRLIFQSDVVVFQRKADYIQRWHRLERRRG